MAEENGKDNPSIIISYDAKATDVAIRWSPELKTYEFLLAVLDMARLKLEDARRMVVTQKQLAAMQEQQQTQELAKKLQLGKG